MAEVRPGDRVEAAIERVVPGGDDLARLSGVVTLVPGGLPGDRVRLRVTEASDRLVLGDRFVAADAVEDISHLAATILGHDDVDPLADRLFESPLLLQLDGRSNF